jgi:tetratricopeptide (TPR) repeat protein
LIKKDDVATWSVFEESVTDSLNSAWNAAKSSDGVSTMAEAYPTWERSPWLETIPQVYQDSLWWKSMATETFLYTDAFFLQEQFWLSQIVARVREEKTGTRFAYLTHAGRTQPVTLEQVVQGGNGQLETSGVERLVLAMKLFDWTVRNVSGEPFPEIPTAEAAAELAVRPLQEGQPWSVAGVRGAGYRNYLWQTLNYGRGDAWEQGHLFLQLARHAGLDACVLGLPAVQPNKLFPRVSHPDLVPWAIGVLVDSEIFLFDPRLGLPLHHPETLSVLTLRQATENPQWLQWHGLTPEESTEADSAYPVRSSDLKNIVALLDYPLECFSLRTQFLQRNLTGANRVEVFFTPDDVAQRFQSHPLIADVQLWALPLETQMFRDSIRDAKLRSTRDRFIMTKIQWQQREEGYFDDFSLLRRSRVLYLLGRFYPDSAELVDDCFKELQRMQYSDDDWKNIADNPDLQKSLGLYQSSGQSAAEFRQALENQKAAMVVVRGDAKMYMAMAHSEIQNHSTAINLLRHVEKFDSENKWKRHKTYLEGRSQEAMKNYEQAIATYLELERQFREARSPRDHGNVLRARMLRRAVPS